jgi:hypothetical protein
VNDDGQFTSAAFAVAGNPMAAATIAVMSRFFIYDPSPIVPA